MGRRLENLEQFGIDVVLERRHGVRASVLRGILYALSFAYDRVVQLRLYFYRKRIFRERALGVLVISVGNLTVGGTGKTPIVEKFARALRAGGRRVAILSRGYKSVPPPTHRKWWQRLGRKVPTPRRIRLMHDIREPALGETLGNLFDLSGVPARKHPRDTELAAAPSVPVVNGDTLEGIGSLLIEGE